MRVVCAAMAQFTAWAQRPAAEAILGAKQAAPVDLHQPARKCDGGGECRLF
jgi:hypothetical protein